MIHDTPTSEILKAIPSPEVIRARLSQLTKEQNILRGLLRLAQRGERSAGRDRFQQEAAHAG